MGLIPGSGRCPGVGNGNPLQYSCLENPHGQRSLAGYSPLGRKELGMTVCVPPARAHTHTHTHTHTHHFPLGISGGLRGDTSYLEVSKAQDK